MKQFDILQHPALGHSTVKNGWSWPGFFFTWIWAFVKGLWLVGVLVLLGSLVTSLLPDLLGFGIALIISIVMGVKGNELRLGRLTDRGYGLVGTVKAETPYGALAIHLATHRTGDPPSENPLA